MENQIRIRGNLAEGPRFSHENHGRKFFRLVLEVPRLSGVCDHLPVIVQGSLLEGLALEGGESLAVNGQIRSHNIRWDGRRRLLVFVFATELAREEGPGCNEVTIEGTLCREPTYRRTPLGREICDVMLAVPRAFQRSDYLPCILWGRTAVEAAQCHTRDRLRIRGRLQSRIYNKVTPTGSQERTAYEISALTADILMDED